MESEKTRLPDFIRSLIGPNRVGVISAIVIVLLTSLVLVYFLLRRRVRRSTVVVFGMCDSGKTLLLSRLCHSGAHRHTVTSIEPNQASYTTRDKRQLTMYDLPGHQRLRDICWQKIRHSVRALLFVVDSRDLSRHVTDTAACLAHVLTDPVMGRYRPPLLVLCNKQDASDAKGAQLIRSQLEREINTLRWTKASTLQDTGSSAEPVETGLNQLGPADQPFSFKQMFLRVHFVEGSCGTEQLPAELESVTEWLDHVA